MFIRGTNTSVPLTFVRVQPYVSPKIESVRPAPGTRGRAGAAGDLPLRPAAEHHAVSRPAGRCVHRGAVAWRHNASSIVAVAMVGLLAWSGCAVGPKYAKPLAPDVASLQRVGDRPAATPGGSRIQVTTPSGACGGKSSATHASTRSRSKSSVSNQNVAAAMANFLSARALVKQSRSQLLPTMTTSSLRLPPSAARSCIGGGAGVDLADRRIRAAV